MTLSETRIQLIRDSQQVTQLVQGYGASVPSMMFFFWSQMQKSQNGRLCVATSSANARNFNCILLRGTGGGVARATRIL